MKSDVDVFSAGMELLIVSEGDCGLRVGMEGHWPLGFVYFGDKFSKPHGLLGSMSGSNILSFGGREGDKRLAL